MVKLLAGLRRTSFFISQIKIENKKEDRLKNTSLNLKFNSINMLKDLKKSIEPSISDRSNYFK